MARKDPERPHPVAAAFEVALGSCFAIWPWWVGVPDTLVGWLPFALFVLAGAAALGFAALNCLAMWEAPPGQLSTGSLVAAFVLAIAWTVGPGVNGGAGSTVARNALVLAYAVIVGCVGWRQRHRPATPRRRSLSAAPAHR